MARSLSASATYWSQCNFPYRQSLMGGGVLIFSSIPFTAVKSLANSLLGERLCRRLEEKKKVAKERSSRFKALTREAREGSSLGAKIATTHRAYPIEVASLSLSIGINNACKELRQRVYHACEECAASVWKPAHLLQHMRSHSVEARGLNLSFCKINLERSVKDWIPCNELQNTMRQVFFLEWTSTRMGDLLRSSTRKGLTHASSHLRDHSFSRLRIAILVINKRII